jgi:hypothetical protein
MRGRTTNTAPSYVPSMSARADLRVFASGAMELWADGVRTGHRLGSLGDAALEAEQPLHVAVGDAEATLCGKPVHDLREYPVDFTAQEQRIRCPRCDAELATRRASDQP